MKATSLKTDARGLGGERRGWTHRRRPLLTLLLFGAWLAAVPADAAKKNYTYETDPIRLGMRALEEGNFDEAQKHFDEAVANEYQIYKAHFGQAEILRMKGLYAEAEPLYRQTQLELAQAKQFDFVERPSGLGMVLFKQGRYAEAAEQFEAALKIKGGEWMPHFGLAMISAQQGDLDKALDRLSRGEKKKGMDEGEDLYNYGMGYVLAKKGDQDQAIQHALKAFSMNPNDPDYANLVAEIYSAQGSATLAISAFETARAQPGFKPTAVGSHTLGVLYEGVKRYNDAIEMYAESVQLDSTYAPGWKDMGELYLLAKRYDEAAGSYARYAQINPQDPEGMIGLAQAALKTKRYAQALDAAQRAYNLDSTRVETRLTLARAAFQSNDKDRARAMYATVEDTLKLKAEDYTRLGQLKQDEGDLDGALEQFETAVRLDSTTSDAYYYMGFIDMKRDLNSEAIENFRRAIQLDPQNPGYYMNLGIALMKVKDYAGAAGAAQKAVELAPTAAQPHIVAAQAFSLAQNWAGAIEQYQKALEIEPQNAGAMRGLGIVYMQQKNYARSEGSLKGATEVEPGSADNWAYYAQALALGNKLAEAVRAAQKALEINPEHPTARKLLDTLKQIQEQGGGQ